MTDLAIPSTASDPAAMARLLGMNPADPKTHAMVAVAQRYDLDPLLKHVVVIPGSGPYLTRDGLLHVAHRSGQFDGMVIESGPDLVDGEWRCVVSVYRKDMARPFTFPGRYSATGGNRKYAPEMAIKVAECMALRRAFDVSGMGVLEEREAGETPQYVEPQRAVEATVERVTPPELTRPVERLTTTPDDDAWQSAPVASEATTTLAAQTPRQDRPFMDNPDGKPSQAQTRMMFALLKAEDGKPRPRDESLAIIAGIVGREVASSADLSKREVSAVIDALQKAGAA